MSIAVTVDFDNDLLSEVMCKINQVVLNIKGVEHDMKCKADLKPVGFSCQLTDGVSAPMCRPDSNLSYPTKYSDCQTNCKSNDQKFSCAFFRFGTVKIPYCSLDP